MTRDTLTATPLTRRTVLAGLMAAPLPALWSPAAQAAQVRYTLDQANSVVNFTYTMRGDPTLGSMDVTRADLLIDLQNVPNSDISVTLAANKAKAGTFLLSRLMRGAEVLNTAQHPDITFKSTKIVGDLSGAKVTGDLTVRGVTLPVTMNANLFRQSGTELTDTSRLQILMTGQIDRRAFGASGYPQWVAPQIDLRIVARIVRAG